MCGKCCKTVTTAYTYEEIKELYNQGDEGAIDFLDIFEPYPSIEAARADSPDIVDNIIKNVEDPEDAKKMTFYKCKHLLADNLCGIYKNRKDLCDVFPSTPWAVVPPGCGFEGWLFEKREEIKQKIRKQKEVLLSLEILLQTANPELTVKINDSIEKIKNEIKSYAKYGSSDW